MIGRWRHVVVTVLILLGLGACGQMGPLYLPDDAAGETGTEEGQGDEQDE